MGALGQRPEERYVSVPVGPRTAGDAKLRGPPVLPGKTGGEAFWPGQGHAIDQLPGGA